jgi:uncharacterized iron-regulated membrane protein
MAAKQRIRRRHVRKATSNYIMAAVLLLLSLFMALSGFILWFALPHGGGRAAITFWSLTRDTWIDIHNRLALVLLVIVIIHLVWHRKWIVYMTKSYFRAKDRSTD